MLLLEMVFIYIVEVRHTLLMNLSIFMIVYLNNNLKLSTALSNVKVRAEA